MAKGSAESIEELTAEVSALRDEVRVLRDAIDELRELIDYVCTNSDSDHEALCRIRRITSMPVDPCADDFAERVNAFTPTDIPPEHSNEKSPKKEQDHQQEPDPLPEQDTGKEPRQSFLASSQKRPANWPATSADSSERGTGAQEDGRPETFPVPDDDPIQTANDEEGTDPPDGGAFAPIDDIIELRFPDGDVSIYLLDGTFLACEEGREEAIRAANFVLTGYRNGASWAPREIESGRGHLQKYFPEIAERYGAKLRT